MRLPGLADLAPAAIAALVVAACAPLLAALPAPPALPAWLGGWLVLLAGRRSVAALVRLAVGRGQPSSGKAA